jgi:hypothetical protein
VATARYFPVCGAAVWLTFSPQAGINSFGSSADYAAYAAVSRSGKDPNKDLAMLARRRLMSQDVNPP